MEVLTERKLSGKRWIPIAITVLVVAIVGMIALAQFKPKEEKKEVDIVATLDKIVQTSDLSSAKFTYEGIAYVPNPKKTTEIDYYVSYAATVYAGIDLNEVSFTEDKEKKEIVVKIPQVRVTDIVVDTSSMEYIFNNKKADNVNITQVALTACEEDVNQEINTESALLEIAQENTVNAIRALTEPIVEQVYKDYAVVIE